MYKYCEIKIYSSSFAYKMTKTGRSVRFRNLQIVAVLHNSRIGLRPKQHFHEPSDVLNRYFRVTIPSDSFRKDIRYFISVTCIRLGNHKSKTFFFILDFTRCLGENWGSEA